jgi:hypothetical protein
MPENAGRKQAINEFLIRVRNGLNLVEEIWIDREIKPRNFEGIECSQAESLSGNIIETVSQLVADDLRFCFKDKNFIFRMIAADAGSGKTAMLHYITQRLTYNQEDLGRQPVPIFGNLNSLLTSPNSEGFSRDFYLYLIGKVFEVAFFDLQDEHFRRSAATCLEELFPENSPSVNLITTSKKSSLVKTKINKLLVESGYDLIETFLEIVSDFNHQGFGLFFLIDELDSLYKSERSKDAVNTFRHLINQVEESYQGKLPLGLYISGLSDDVKSFINKEEALKTRVYPGEVRLVRFRNRECHEIREKIENRLFDAYRGYKDFPQFKQELDEIELKPGADFNSLREFCQSYGARVLEIHNQYFTHHDKSFNQFEAKSRDKLQEVCIKRWQEHLGTSPSPIHEPLEYQNHSQWQRWSGKNRYELIVAQTTTHLAGHNFDGYAELRHSGDVIAKAFGEAKNYELIQYHFTKFKTWLEDVGFDAQKSTPDLAYVFAPSCPELIKLKLQNSDIEFYPLSKVEEPPQPKPPEPGTNVNTAGFDDLVQAFQGSGMRRNTIKRIIERRKEERYENLEQMFQSLGSTAKVRKKLQDKLNNREIYFGSDESG